MFTGIVEEIGQIRSIQRGAASSVLTVQGRLIFDDLKIGDSVAVNGVCLTVASCSHQTFKADVMHETLRRSSLGSLQVGSRVNLERAMPACGRFGGHIVTGHIDAAGVIAAIQKDDVAILYTIKAPDKIMKYIVEKGSVAIDGISLTVAEAGDGFFVVSVIPHTASATILSEKSPGAAVNLEGDIIGKYVEKLMSHNEVQQETNEPDTGSGSPVKRTLSKELLIKYGFGG